MKSHYNFTISTIILICIASLAAAQSEIAEPVGKLDIERFKTEELDYDEIKGSPFLEKDYLQGYVKLIDNKKTAELKLQFDIYTSEFFFLSEDEKEVIIDLRLVREIYMQGKEEDYLFKRVNPRKPHEFYEIIYEEKGLKIYNAMQINFIEGQDLGISKIEAKFSRRNNYYLLKNRDVPKRIKLKKKDVLKLFDKGKRSEIESIAKSQKNKLKKPKDFKRLFKVLGSR